MIIGQTLRGSWTVTNLTTGAEENATGTPTALLYKNGTVVGAATPSVSNPGTGHYHASVLLDAAHSWAVGDHYSLVASWVEPGTSAAKKLILAQGVITEAMRGTDGVPTNPMLATEDGSSFTAIPDMATATSVNAIKAKTDQLIFTIPNQIDANALSGAGGLDASGIRAAIGLDEANLDIQLEVLPTLNELNSRTRGAF